MIARIPGGHRTVSALIVSLALFLVIAAVLAVTMARGDDPALRTRRSADTPRRQEQPSLPPGAQRGDDQDDDWQGGRGWDDEYQAPPLSDWSGQQGPPVRSGTS
ncbi:unannotated protein [freshwater metagenome]|uniref:Unannotated protein n=1 Tax=freshwater metagenome TaxID=449393 RepID=A0A6J7EHU9_9ZZZZ|nr:hypothetical protein [Actinomycetota bacterium]